MDKITGSVGKEGDNLAQDVELIQKLLNDCEIPGENTPLDEDGLIGNKTIRRIEAFQKKIVLMTHPDGRVDPNGKTFRTLLEHSRKEKTASFFSLSDKAINLLKSIEQLATTPYDDQTGQDISAWVKGATIGYGHLIAAEDWNKYKNGLTAEQALELFESDLAPYSDKVKSSVTTLITQNQFDAMIIFTFNIGVNAFGSSSALKLINDPTADTSYPDLEAAWKAWNRSQNKLSQGLVNRRQSEWNIYANNLYQKW